MATSEKTYSFRAPADFGERLAAARRAWVELADEGPEIASWLSSEFAMELARQRHRSPEMTQSAFIRSLAEALVKVTEEVAEGLELQRRHREIEARLGPDPEAAEWAEAGLKLMAEAYMRDGET